MTDFQETTSLVVVDENAVFDGEVEAASIDDAHLKHWLDRAMEACKETAEQIQQKEIAEKQQLVEQIQLLIGEIQVYRKNYAVALGYLLTYMQDTGLYEAAGFRSLQEMCTMNLGIPNSDRIFCMNLYQAGAWMQRVGYSLEQATDSLMTPVVTAEIVRVATKAAEQANKLQLQYKNKPEQLRQVLEEEQEELVALIDTIRLQGDQQIIDKNERRIGSLERQEAALLDIRIHRGQIMAVLNIPATKDSATLLARALRGAFNVLCRTTDNPAAAFNISELPDKLFTEEEL